MKFIKITASVLLSVLLLISFSSCISFRKINDVTEEKSTVGTSKTTEIETSTVSTAATEQPTEAQTSTVSTETEAPVTADTSAVISKPQDNNGAYSPDVYMYHLIMEEPTSTLEGLFVRPSEFAAQLDALNKKGVRYLFADEYAKTDTPSVVLTFDDGYEDNYTEMFPILKEKGARATIFLISGWIGGDGYLKPEQITEMAQSGLVRFGCHTESHVDLSNSDENGIRAQITSANEYIESLVGYPIRAIAYPAGGYNDTVTRVAAEYFDFAYTTENPATKTDFDMMTIPRVRVNRGQGASVIK